jgi:hypothetical protein
MWKLAQVVLFAALLQAASAQRMGGGGAHFGASLGSSLGSPHFGAGNFPSQRAGGFSPYLPYAIPFFSDGLYSDAVYAPAYGAPPAIIVMQPPAPAADPERTAPPAQPLLIELQGDRYVRISGDESSSAQMIDQASGPKARSLVSAAQPAQAPEPVSTLLVFRDGHREEISDYTIAGGILYSAGDYYAGGTGSKKIDLSALNLTETVASNRSRGVAFRLPRAANEVIVGP